jgi:hypothetical protein
MRRFPFRTGQSRPRIRAAWAFVLAACALAVLARGTLLRGALLTVADVTPSGACGDSETLFKSTGSGTVNDWSKTYHATVGRVVQESLLTNATSIVCTDHPYVRASPALQALGRALPTWQNPAVILTENEMPAVLLEYLRVYECALQERSYFLSTRLEQEIAGAQNSSAGGGKVFAGLTVVQAMSLNGQQIARELDLSRKALERTLTLLAGQRRLNPLLVNLQCLERASLDIRNGLGLAAEAGTVFWRGLDARAFLYTP